MDKKDLLIMSYLRINARETLTRLSKKTNVPISTVYERIRNNNIKLITKHTTLIDFTKLGYMARANILIKTNGNKKQVKEFLSKHHHINNMIKINNGYDYMVEVVFRHVHELEAFIENLEDKFNIKKRGSKKRI